MTEKTSINNLLIVWQGQSWSVLAPDGSVLARFKEKPHAIKYAQGNIDFNNEIYSTYENLPPIEKPKRKTYYAYGESNSYQSRSTTRPRSKKIYTDSRPSAKSIIFLIIFLLSTMIILKVIWNYITSHSFSEILHSNMTIPFLAVAATFNVSILSYMDKYHSNSIKRYLQPLIGCFTIITFITGIFFIIALVILGILSEISPHKIALTAMLWYLNTHTLFHFALTWEDKK